MYRKVSSGFRSLVTFPKTNLAELTDSSSASPGKSSQKGAHFLSLQREREARPLHQLQEPTLYHPRRFYSL